MMVGIAWCYTQLIALCRIDLLVVGLHLLGGGGDRRGSLGPHVHQLLLQFFDLLLEISILAPECLDLLGVLLAILKLGAE